MKVADEPLAEDSDERRMFDEAVALYGDDPLLAIAAALEVWAKTTPPQGSFAKACAIYANELREHARNCV